MTSGQATRTQSETIEEQGEGTAQGHDVNEPLGYFQVCLGFDRASALDHRSGPVWLIKGKAPPEHFGIKRVVGAFADGTVTAAEFGFVDVARQTAQGIEILLGPGGAGPLRVHMGKGAVFL